MKNASMKVARKLVAQTNSNPESKIVYLPLTKFELGVLVRSLASANEYERTEFPDQYVNTWLAERVLRILEPNRL